MEWWRKNSHHKEEQGDVYIGKTLSHNYHSKSNN